MRDAAGQDDAGHRLQAGSSPSPPEDQYSSLPEEMSAWKDLGDGRWLPYRIRGSWRGVLG